LNDGVIKNNFGRRNYNDYPTSAKSKTNPGGDASSDFTAVEYEFLLRHG